MKPATRMEKDSLGAVEVPAEHYWGAQTQRSLAYFTLTRHRMPLEMVQALALVKKAAAKVNYDLGRLPAEKAAWIMQAADEILAGQLAGEFPLSVWQTGSGTQSNMNLNEVIANRAIELAGGKRGSKTPVHPNNDVNLSQSSNDVFPTAMHVAAVRAFRTDVLPAAKELRDTLAVKAVEYRDLLKIGRTHLQDAVPMTLGQEFSGYVAQLDDALAILDCALPGLHKLALGGTAIGTGLNAPPGFAENAAAEIAALTGEPFVTAPNKFAALAAHDALVAASGALRLLAVVLMKIANDIRWLGCGPRCGLAELILPDNEPGSSIMPGKINPTQSEALTMIAVQVIGLDTAVAIAGSQGNFELNVFKPLIIFNVLESAAILAGGCRNFARFMIADLKPNTERLRRYVQDSLMLVTALNPAIGYDRAAEIARLALAENLTLREACLRLAYLSGEEFDRLVQPQKMVGP